MTYNYQYPFALVFEEKHGSYAYLIQNQEELFKIALDILKRRNKDNYYPKDARSCEKEIKKAELILKDLEKINYLEKHNPHLNEAHTRAIIDRNEAQKDLVDIKNIACTIKSKNGQNAWEIIRSRSGYEYEKHDMIYFQNVKYDRI